MPLRRAHIGSHRAAPRTAPMLIAGLASLVVAASASLLWVPTADAASSSTLQRINVRVAKGSTKGKISLYNIDSKGSHIIRSSYAYVGSQGVSASPSEKYSRTPLGRFGLTEGFGRSKAPSGTRIKYHYIGHYSSYWWVADTNSRYYNTYQHCAASSCNFNTSKGENLGNAGSVYNQAVVINYNRSPVKRGAGSGFFLHIANGRPTAGCVSTDAATISYILKWLDPKKDPRIDIGYS